jgi:hypothetical protein
LGFRKQPFPFGCIWKTAYCAQFRDPLLCAALDEVKASAKQICIGGHSDLSCAGINSSQGVCGLPA